MKVFIVQEIVSPFRIKFFEKLSRIFDLTVLHSYPTKVKNRKLQDYESFKFGNELFKNTTFFKGRISYHSQLIKYVKINKPDLLILEARLGFITALSLGCRRDAKYKIVWWLSGYESSHNILLILFKRIIFRLIFKFSDGFICYSAKGKDYLSKLGIYKNIYIAHNTIDTIEIEKWKKYYSLNNECLIKFKQGFISENDIVLISIGRIEADKNIIAVINAIKILRDKNISNIKYICIGDGSLLKDLKLKTIEYNIQDSVLFTGDIRDEELLSKYLLNSHIFIMPGLGGLSLNHGLAYGLPIILSSGDGSEKDKVIEEYNGYYFDKQNNEELVLKILTFYNNPAFIEEMGKNSLKLYYENYTIESYLNSFKDAVNEIILK